MFWCVPFFLSLDTALPPREDYVQVDCVLKPRYKKCTEKEKIKMIGLKRIYPYISSGISTNPLLSIYFDGSIYLEIRIN